MKNQKLMIYNTLEDKAVEFKSIIPNKVMMYACGPTVYNHAHIGNFRPIIVFALLKNLLKLIGYEVVFASNYTDIDDRIINKAIEEKVDESVIAERYIESYEAVLKSLNIEKPDLQPRVSNYIPQIIAYIQTIIDEGSAYVRSGDVFFRVNKCHDYGCLSNIKLHEIEVGSRVEENENKENPVDFALWKKTDVGIRWSSPWSEGRPGWHTECSVMINSLFPNGLIDIHGGGMDLKFPHHENEIAQSEAHNHNHLANYWVHNGFVNVKGDKMSKSLGNVLLGQDAAKLYGGEVVKFTILSTHYRAPINLTEDVFETSRVELEKIHSTFNMLSVRIQLLNGDRSELFTAKAQDFIDQLCDDLNISNALSVLYQQLKEVNVLLRNAKTPLHQLEEYYRSLKIMLNTLALEDREVILSAEDHQLYQQYVTARDEKNFTLSDDLRKELIKRKIL